MEKWAKTLNYKKELSRAVYYSEPEPIPDRNTDRKPSTIEYSEEMPGSSSNIGINVINNYSSNNPRDVSNDVSC
jgi:hypothetical protein